MFSSKYIRTNDLTSKTCQTLVLFVYAPSNHKHFHSWTMKQTQTTVLGKRKATAHSDTFVLLLSPTPSSSAPLPEEPDTDSSYNQASGSNGNLIIVNGNLIPQTKKCYRCTYQGCEKAYSKPSRLEEHERSHTGQVSIYMALKIRDSSQRPSETICLWHLRKILFERNTSTCACSITFTRECTPFTMRKTWLRETVLDIPALAGPSLMA